MLKKILLATCCVASLSTAQAKEVILKVSHFLPPTSNYQKGVLEPWCETLSAESNGQLKCQIYPAMQLGGTPAQLPDQVRNGVSDVVLVVPGYSVGRFPAIEALDLPFTMPPESSRASAIMWEYYQKHSQSDFAQFKMLGVFSSGSFLVMTKNKPVLTRNDFKTVKLRCASRQCSKMMQALDATPINLPGSQVTEAVSKSVIDGAMAAWDLATSIKLEEVADYFVDVPTNSPAFAQTALTMLMNQTKYDSLPSNLKEILDRNTGDALVQRASLAWDQASAEGVGKAKAAGGQTLTIDTKEYEAMKADTQSVAQDWIAEVNKRDLKGEELLKGLYEIAAKHAK